MREERGKEGSGGKEKKEMARICGSGRKENKRNGVSKRPAFGKETRRISVQSANPEQLWRRQQK